MAYTKQEFKSGDKLYAAQLNAMDAQIAANEKATERLSEEIAAAVDIDETALNEMLIGKCGDVRRYGEFVTALRSENGNPDFIDLGFIEEVNGHPLTDFSFEVTFRVDDKSSVSCAIFGAMPEYSSNNFSIIAIPGLPHMNIFFGYYQTPIVIAPIEEGTVYTAKVGARGVEVNGTAYAITPSETTIMQSYKNLYLFAANTGMPGVNTPEHNSGTKSIYDFKVYSGDTLIRHFKPYVTNRGVPCMVDIVNGNKEYYPTYGTLIVE